MLVYSRDSRLNSQTFIPKTKTNISPGGAWKWRGTVSTVTSSLNPSPFYQIWLPASSMDGWATLE